MVVYWELHIYFAVQILTWMAEMSLSLQVDLMLSDATSTIEA